MSDAPVSRGKFLKSLGSSMTGMVLGSGIAVAAQTLAKRIAVIAHEMDSAPPPPGATAESEVVFIESGPAEGNRIALTFDDGPTPGITESILDELKSRKLVATFFMIGQCVLAAPELARRVLTEGHEVANHSFTHPKLNTLTDVQVAAELQKTQDAFTDVLQHRATLLRPPYGAFRKNQNDLAQKAGLRVVLGSVDSRDWSQPGEDKIIENIVPHTQAGSIIICHDKHAQTANCLGQILDQLLSRGFSFVTVSSLVDETHPKE